MCQKDIFTIRLMDEQLALGGDSTIVAQCCADSSAVTLYANLFMLAPPVRTQGLLTFFYPSMLFVAEGGGGVMFTLV